MDDVFKISAAILTSLGGGVLIVGSFTYWLGNLWASRLIQNEKKKLEQDLESYKVKLKKSEFLFQKEFEAASEFVEIKQGLLPTYLHPEMEWYDACDYVAQSIDEIEFKLRNYLSRHGAILKNETRHIVSVCIGIAGKNKFEIESPETNSTTNAAANDLYEKLEEIEKLLINEVHSQSST